MDSCSGALPKQPAAFCVTQDLFEHKRGVRKKKKKKKLPVPERVVSASGHVLMTHTAPDILEGQRAWQSTGGMCARFDLGPERLIEHRIGLQTGCIVANLASWLDLAARAEPAFFRNPVRRAG